MVWLSPSIQIISRCNGNFPTLCVYTVVSNDKHLRETEHKNVKCSGKHWVTLKSKPSFVRGILIALRALCCQWSPSKEVTVIVISVLCGALRIQCFTRNALRTQNTMFKLNTLLWNLKQVQRKTLEVGQLFQRHYFAHEQCILNFSWLF